MSLASFSRATQATFRSSPCTRTPCRSFFNLPSPFSSGSSSSASGAGTLTKRGSLTVYEESREMPYAPHQLYTVIADVDSYQDFLPFASSSRVLSAARLGGSSGKEVARTDSKSWLEDDGRDGDEWELEAELQVGAMGFQESYVSKVRAKKFQLVSANAKDTSIFKHLETSWKLTPLATGPAPRTRVDLYLAYSFISPFHAMAASATFEKISPLMIKGFEKRVQQVHGQR